MSLGPESPPLRFGSRSDVFLHGKTRPSDNVGIAPYAAPPEVSLIACRSGAGDELDLRLSSQGDPPEGIGLNLHSGESSRRQAVMKLVGTDRVVDVSKMERF